MTLLLSLPLFVLGLLAQEAAPSATETRPAPAPVQRLRVIVEDAEGKRVAGARIFFASNALSSLDPHPAPEQLEFAGDKRGRAIVSLDPRQDWAAWAVKSEGKKRWASTVQMRVMEKGILRLILQSFPVPFVRISNLAPWKRLFQGKLSLIYISESLPLPRFRADLPEGKDEVCELPPLPMGNYFPVLWHEDRGFLDTVYLSPAFHQAEDDAEVLYERDYPLKKCIFGRPLLLRGRVKDMKGKPVADARLRAGPSNRIPCQLRQNVSTDAEGKFELVVPFKPESRRTSYFSDVVIWAPGSLPEQHSVESLCKSFQTKLKEEGEKASPIFARDFELIPGHTLEWKLSGAKARDEVFLLTQVLQGGNPGVRLGMKVQALDGGQLSLPGSRFVGGLGALFSKAKQNSRSRLLSQLYLRRDGQIFALAGRVKGQVPQKLALDLTESGTLELHGLSVSGRALKRGYCEVRRVFSDGLAQIATSFGLQAGGPTCLDLPVGKYVMRISQKPLGLGYASFEIQKGKKTKIEIQVEPYLRLRGKILCEDEEVKIAGLSVQVYPQQLLQKKVPILARAWAQQSLQQTAILSREDGSFDLLVSPFVQRLNVQTYASVANRYLSAQAMIDPHAAKEVELQLR